jgi:hypothetical protein
MEALIFACALIAAGTGIATFHAVGHGGHIEIGPAAVAHAHAHAQKTRVEPKRSRTPPAPPPSTSALVGQRPLLRGAHDPKALLATAKDLQWMRLDVSIGAVEMAKPFLTRDAYADFWPGRVLPVYGPGDHIDGLELRGIPADSPLREAGFADGDQLLGIDGYDFYDDTFKNVDVVQARKRGWAVVEIARANHHVVLSIHWPVP